MYRVNMLYIDLIMHEVKFCCVKIEGVCLKWSKAYIIPYDNWLSCFDLYFVLTSQKKMKQIYNSINFKTFIMHDLSS
jgi:hypothetical protein